MIIRRAQRSKNFTVVGNDILDDERLTDELGLLIYLISRPDNWRISVEQLQRRFGYGRDKVQRIMKTLRDAGYARLEKLHDPATGKWQGNGYVVSDEPMIVGERADAETELEGVVEPHEPTSMGGDREPENTVLGESVNTESLKNRQPDYPAAGKHGSIIRTHLETNTNLETKPLKPQRGGGGRADADWEEFDRAWRWDPVDIKQQARRVFDKLLATDRAMAIRYARPYGDECLRRDRKIVNARTWLRGRGWEAMASVGVPASVAAAKAFIAVDSPQFAAWSRYHGKKLVAFDVKGSDGRSRRGRYEDSEWPPPRSAQGNHEPMDQSAMRAAE